MAKIEFHFKNSKCYGTSVWRNESDPNGLFEVGLFREFDVLNSRYNVLKKHNPPHSYTINERVIDNNMILRIIESSLCSSSREDKDNSDDILYFLQLRNEIRTTFGHIIASDADPEHTLAYLDIINTLLEKSADAATRIVRLFKMRTLNKKWTFGSYLARCEKPDSVIAYLNIINVLMDSANVSAKDIVSLFQLQNAGGWTFGDFVAGYLPSACTLAYLAAIKKILASDMSLAKDIVDLLLKKNDEGFCFRDHIARHQDETCFSAYLEIIEMIRACETVSTKAFEKLHTFYHDSESACAYLSAIKAQLENKEISAQDVVVRLQQASKRTFHRLLNQ